MFELLCGHVRQFHDKLNVNHIQLHEGNTNPSRILVQERRAEFHLHEVAHHQEGETRTRELRESKSTTVGSGPLQRPDQNRMRANGGIRDTHQTHEASLRRSGAPLHGRDQSAWINSPQELCQSGMKRKKLQQRQKRPSRKRRKRRSTLRTI